MDSWPQGIWSLTVVAIAQGVQFYGLAVAKSSSANGKILVQRGEFAIYQNVFLSLNMWRSLDVLVSIFRYIHLVWWVVGWCIQDIFLCVDMWVGRPQPSGWIVIFTFSLPFFTLSFLWVDLYMGRWDVSRPYHQPSGCSPVSHCHSHFFSFTFSLLLFHFHFSYFSYSLSLFCGWIYMWVGEM